MCAILSGWDIVGRFLGWLSTDDLGDRGLKALDLGKDGNSLTWHHLFWSQSRPSVTLKLSQWFQAEVNIWSGLSEPYVLSNHPLGHRKQLVPPVGWEISSAGNNTLIRHIVTGPEDPKMVEQAGRAERLKDGVNMTCRNKIPCFKCYIKKIKTFQWMKWRSA